ncbi:MAG: hypothetical protein HUJ31_02520 [Pseudomonadales bacterium]|nr:hypothetical protein [Pseudomonadales bacterium]
MGTFAGGLIALRLNVMRPMLFGVICCFFFAGPSLALSVPAPLLIIMCTAFVSGVAGQIFMVLWYTTLQTQIPSNMLSRVGAYDHLGSIAMIPLGVVAGGFLFEVMGGTATMLIAAVVIVMPTALVLLVPDVRRLRIETVTRVLPESG